MTYFTQHKEFERQGGGWEVGKEKMKQGGIRRETNHKRLLISRNKLRVAGGRGIGRGCWGYGHWERYV